MIKFCQKCYEEHRAFSPSGYYAFLKENVSHCILNDCGGELQDIDFPAQDLADIMNVSESKEFIDAMIHLRQENIIEYELKCLRLEQSISLQNSTTNPNPTFHVAPNVAQRQSPQSTVASLSSLGLLALAVPEMYAKNVGISGSRESGEIK